MLPAGHGQILLQICDRLENEDILWTVTGSTSFALQGMELPVHDIDIQTDAESAYLFEKKLAEFVEEPVHFCGNEKIRSHFGKFRCNNIEIEVMGDVQKPQQNGIWGAPTDILKWRRYILFHGKRIPVLDLEYEIEAYRRIGRLERAEQMAHFLATNTISYY